MKKSHLAQTGFLTARAVVNVFAVGVDPAGAGNRAHTSGEVGIQRLRGVALSRELPGKFAAVNMLESAGSPVAMPRLSPGARVSVTSHTSACV